MAGDSENGHRNLGALCLSAGSRPAVAWSLCLAVAVFYTVSALVSSQIQKGCGYTPAFLIQYMNDGLLGLVSLLLFAVFAWPPREELYRLLRWQGPWSFLFAPLALAANVSFTVALRLTSTASAVSLEQLTSLFIAVLSYFVLKSRYRLISVPLLFVAVGGAVLATLGDSGGSGGVAGSAPVLGDMLTLVVALLAGGYMVIFKLVFPSLQPSELLFFFTLKGLVTLLFGWIGVIAFNALGWEEASVPTGCAAVWVPIGAIVSILFNYCLNWATLTLSPLTARLSLLLGIPCSFAVDVVLGSKVTVARLVGVLLVFVGVLGFEATKTPPKTAAETLSQNGTSMEKGLVAPAQEGGAS